MQAGLTQALGCNNRFLKAGFSLSRLVVAFTFSYSAARLGRPALNWSDRTRLGTHAHRCGFGFVSIHPSHPANEYRPVLGRSPISIGSDRLQPNNSFKPSPLHGLVFAVTCTATLGRYAGRLNSGVRPQDLLQWLIQSVTGLSLTSYPESLDSVG